jgi:hypothetical protein
MRLDWQRLRNPVLGYDHWSIKDACMTWRDGLFHVFFSAFDEKRSAVAAVTTPDFLSFTPPVILADGRDTGCIGMCSPDLTQQGHRYVLTLNSWGDDPARPNRLFYMESSDLTRWSTPCPLAPELTNGNRAIDAALAREGDRWFLAYKGPDWRTTRLATATAVGGPWSFVGGGLPQLLMADGRPNGLTHENYQFLKLDGRWRLLCTDYSPHHAHLYAAAGAGRRASDWLQWTEGRRLDVPAEPFNGVDVDNAASMFDARDLDGFLYLLYAGKGEERRGEFNGTASAKPWPRGWNRLALARSRDGLRWTVPGQPDAAASPVAPENAP